MEPNLSALIQASKEARPSDFQSQANDLLSQRIMDALERRRQEIAQSMNFHDEKDAEQTGAELETDQEINSDENQSNDEAQIEEPNG